MGLLCKSYTGKRSALPFVLKVDTEGGAFYPSRTFPRAMFDGEAKPERSWQDIIAEAATASRENNLERLADLRKELGVVLGRRNEVIRAGAGSEKKLPTPRKTA